MIPKNRLAEGTVVLIHSVDMTEWKVERLSKESFFVIYNPCYKMWQATPGMQISLFTPEFVAELNTRHRDIYRIIMLEYFLVLIRGFNNAELFNLFKLIIKQKLED